MCPELRLMARRHMKNERQANSLQITALVREVYRHPVEVTSVEWRERSQFFAMAAQMMRRIPIDAARARTVHKCGRALRVNLDETALFRSLPVNPSWPSMRPSQPPRRLLRDNRKSSSCVISADCRKRESSRF